VITDKIIISQTKKWIKTVIIAMNICPFARQEVERDRVHYRVVRETELELCLQALIDECIDLSSSDDIETSLIVFPETFSLFDDYLDFVEISNDLLIDQGYEGIYQLASFHPNYSFANSEKDDPANYTNRSVYPMLHVIREASLEKALKNYPHPERIPENNIKLTRQLGLEKMKLLLNNCYEFD